MANYEEYIDLLATVVADQEDSDGYGTPLEDDELVALEKASEALAFCQSLWNVLRDNGLKSVNDEPDLFVIEKALDLMFAELAAATLVFSDDAFKKMPEFFKGFAKKLQDLDNPDVPPEIAQGAIKFANRLENARKLQACIESQRKVVDS